jgi:alpha-ketoglutarate-dependent taurine dioxygenase
VHHSPTGDPNNDTNQENKAIGTTWHSDISFKDQPPGITVLYVLGQPEIGGDTLFADGVEAYNRLSPTLQRRLHGLKAVHSNHKSYERIKAEGGVIRREPTAAEHPLVRTHSVTGEKALYVHGGCEWTETQRPFAEVLPLIWPNS